MGQPFMLEEVPLIPFNILRRKPEILFSVKPSHEFPQRSFIRASGFRSSFPEFTHIFRMKNEKVTQVESGGAFHFHVRYENRKNGND